MRDSNLRLPLDLPSPLTNSLLLEPEPSPSPPRLSNLMLPPLKSRPEPLEKLRNSPPERLPPDRNSLEPRKPPPERNPEPPRNEAPAVALPEEPDLPPPPRLALVISTEKIRISKATVPQRILKPFFCFSTDILTRLSAAVFKAPFCGLRYTFIFISFRSSRRSSRKFIARCKTFSIASSSSQDRLIAS